MPAADFILLGDALWLDFLNTARGRESQGPDRLREPADWARWCQLLRLAPEPESFPAALTLRDQLLDLATALATSSPPPSSSIRTLNARLRDIPGTLQLVRVAGRWNLPFVPARLPGNLDAIAQSAADTMALPLAELRICAGPSCTLFLLDRSPQLTRRWCSPTHCGKGMRVERRRRAPG